MILNAQSKGTVSVDPDAWILFSLLNVQVFFYHNCVLQELFKQPFEGKKKKETFVKILHEAFIIAQKESDT